MLTVADLMTPNPLAVRPDDDLVKAYDLLHDNAIRHLPVVDEDGDVVGVLSQRDLLRGALGGLEELPLTRQREYLELRTVGSLMVGEPEVCSPDDALRDAGQTMLDNKYGCMLVVEGERLVGILTEADFVAYVVQTLGD